MHVISSPARKHQWPLILGGATLMLVTVLAQAWLIQFKQQLMLLALVGLVMIVAGVVTRFEPVVSLSLSDKKLRYYHRYGQWTLRWSNVLRIFQPTFIYGLESKNVPYIGIKLKDIELISQRISPRLASRLIHEQRDLLILARQQGELTNEQATINFSPYKTASGYVVTGPIAAWLHHSESLCLAYGAHLFLPLSCCNLTSQELVAQLNEHFKTAILELEKEGARRE